VLSACAEAPTPTRNQPRDLVPEIVAPDGTTTLDAEDLSTAGRPITRVFDPRAAAFDVATSPCDCTTVECTQNWVDQALGCGIVIDFVCSDGHRVAAYLACQ
jgi:hypothetical protein